MKTAYVGNCHKCGKSAAWNQPAIDPSNHLWCDRCKDDDRTGIEFRTIDSRLENGKYIFDGGVALNGVIVWGDRSTWANGGSRAVHLTEQEKLMQPIDLARLLNEEYNVKGLTRCTGCGIKMTKDQIAGYPLFAGVVCAPCWAAHQKHLEDQAEKGHVCSFCRKPYDNCCC